MAGMSAHDALRQPTASCCLCEIECVRQAATASADKQIPLEGASTAADSAEATLQQQLAETKAKLAGAAAKLNEQRCANAALKADLSKTQRALQRELGDEATVMQATDEGGSWKGTPCTQTRGIPSTPCSATAFAHACVTISVEKVSADSQLHRTTFGTCDLSWSDVVGSLADVARSWHCLGGQGEHSGYRS